jgi:hypothetical protein
VFTIAAKAYINDTITDPPRNGSTSDIGLAADSGSEAPVAVHMFDWRHRCRAFKLMGWPDN